MVDDRVDKQNKINIKITNIKGKDKSLTVDVQYDSNIYDENKIKYQYLINKQNENYINV